MEPDNDDEFRLKWRPRQRKIHYIAAALHDGAIFATYPERKPSPKSIRQRGYRIDDDGVLNQKSRGGQELKYGDERRFRGQDILANRLNTRRAIRELVLPVLEDLRLEIATLRAEIGQLSGQKLASEAGKGSPPASFGLATKRAKKARRRLG